MFIYFCLIYKKKEAFKFKVGFNNYINVNNIFKYNKILDAWSQYV